MPQDKIRDLLQQADLAAGRPTGASVNLSAIRRRANRRRLVGKAVGVAAAAVLVAAAGIWQYNGEGPVVTTEQDRIVALETQIKQLQARTDAALSLIHEVLEDDRKERRLNELHAELASIPDPLEQIAREVDKTAFTLVYHADQLYYELNQTDSAVEAYNQVIVLFPNNRWAEVARQRLTDIKEKKPDKPSSEGDSKWKQQSA